MATVTEAVKDFALGTAMPADLSQEARANFLKFAKQGEDGEYYMDQEAFVNAIAPPGEDYHKIKRETYGILFHVADRRDRGKVTISDWAVFDNLLSKPDAEYEIAFRLFDVDRSGSIKSDVFQQIYEQNRAPDSIPFDWNSQWASLYIGTKQKRHEMTYEQFAQMMRGLQGERIRQAFHLFDTDGDGFIEPEHFEKIIRDTCSHKLSDHLLDNLPTLCNISQGSNISYANVRAFLNVIHELDLVDLIVRNATAKSADGKITRTDFLNEAARITRFSLFTPMEADIMFHFASLDSPSGRLSLEDFAKVVDASWRTTEAVLGAAAEAADRVVSRSRQMLHNLLESAHHFALGSVAGAFGAFMVYPIDLVKTRMQNQRVTAVGGRLYENSLDCARKVLRNEGFRGFYSGVIPQLVGVAPEKAIKLTVNDMVRGRFTDKQTGHIEVWAELLAGGSAGACQVIFTNPLEIVKIRLQMQGELLKRSDAVTKRSAMWIVRNLGIMGLYKGASACLMRDVPFSAIYFPTYNHLKRDVFGESPAKKLGVVQLLTAGAIAGMPAAYLTTPCDVIKTRLQVEARKGETTYTGLVDCARKIWRQEGFRAFFKGGPARVLRSSPQFGFTLAAYEVLTSVFPMPGTQEAELKKALTGHVEHGLGLREDHASLPYLRSRNALKIILDIDQNFSKFRLPPKELQGRKILGLGFSKPGNPPA